MAELEPIIAKLKIDISEFVEQLDALKEAIQPSGPTETVPSQPTLVRHCFGSSVGLLEIASDNPLSAGSQSDQFLALGQWLSENADHAVHSVNVHVGDDGRDWITAVVYGASTKGSIPDRTTYG